VSVKPRSKAPKSKAPKSQPPKSEPRWFRWLRRLQESRIIVTMGVLGGLLVWLSAETDAIDKLLMFMGPKPDSAKMERDAKRDAERDRFVHDLTLLASERVQIMSKYLTAVQKRHPSASQDEAWQQYVRTFDEWNVRLKSNINDLQQYYGSAKRAQFEGFVQLNFRFVHMCLQNIHTPSDALHCELTPADNLDVVDKAVQRLDKNVYCFFTNLPKAEPLTCFKPFDPSYDRFDPSRDILPP
jgi:hypothetical protein